MVIKRDVKCLRNILPVYNGRPSVAEQVANNHNRNNNATVSTQMS